MRLHVPSILLFFFTLAGTSHAQTTGKIQGKVTDISGDPLPAVSVVIEDISRGTSTDMNGEYFLLNIRPGSYTMYASMVGFARVVKTDVRVSVDRTTTINFELEEEVFQGQEIIVAANRKLVTRDQTSASAKVSGDEILALPAPSFLSAVSVQAGVSEGQDGDLHIRGGRTSEIKYYVDGVAISNPFTNSLASPVENTAVQEVEVISGTYNAEYGQANSGIVNIVTREGGNSFKGTFVGSLGTYRTGNERDFFGLSNSSLTGEQSYEGSLSGPVLRDKLTFFTNIKYANSEGWLFGQRVFAPSDSSDFSSTNPENWNVEATGDSSFVSMNNNESLTTMGKLSWRLTRDFKVSYTLTRSNSEGQFYRHLYRLNPDYLPTQQTTSYNHLVAINHVINNSSFYNIRLTAYTTDFSQNKYEDPFDERYSVIEGRSNQPEFVFSVGGVDNYHLRRKSATYAARFDITKQFGSLHLAKAGVEFRYNELDFREFFVQARRVNNFERTIPPLSSRLHNAYNRQPMEAAAFIQDKIEYRDLIVNVGLRFDYFDAQFKVPTDLRDPSNTRGVPESEAFRNTSAKWQVSPRLGFAFPISENSVVHASYGQFFQIPEYSRLYENPDFQVESSNFSQFLGNANIEPQSSTTYEIGLQQQIGEYFGFDITAYYRDLRNLIGTTLYAARTGGDTWGRYENTDFGRVRGFTLATTVRTNIGIRGSVNYTFQSVRGNASDPRQAFFNAQQNNETTRNLLPLDWDQMHNISGNLTYLHDRFSAGLLSTFHTGYPFTPQDEQRNNINVLRNQARYSPEFILDLRAAYRLQLAGTETQLFFNARNLLNFYRDDREPKITQREIEAHQANGNTRINSLTDFRTNPAVQPAPRLVSLGLQVNF